MEQAAIVLGYLLPWEISLPWLTVCLAGAWFYLRGARRLRALGRPVPGTRRAAYLLGLAGIYVVTQTHYDYLAQYMFFTHRIQHLVLHHMSPFLIAAAAPWPVLATGLPRWCRTKLVVPLARNRPLCALYRLVQSPLAAPLLFVGLIYFWLVPSIHFDAMLSRRLYDVMNWSMAVDGLLFWWLILDPRPGGPGTARIRYGMRMLLVCIIIPPQIVLGAYIGLNRAILFDVYDVCGRAWPLDALTDQQIGGLVTWIPAAMMSVAGALVVLRRMLGTPASATTASVARP